MLRIAREQACRSTSHAPTPMAGELFPQGSGAVRPRVDPGLDQLPEHLLVARRRLPALAGVPAPADQAVVGHVLVEGGEILAAVARRVLDLGADRAERLALPRHLKGRELPLRVTRHALQGY